jgi:membrane protein DedA with SNARE-associated domain
MSDWSIGAALAFATLVSEDAATITAGLLVSSDTLDFLPAALSAGAGIYAGDLGLFLFGRSARRWPSAARFIETRWTREEMVAIGRRFERGTAMIVVGSRLVPGSRLPLYVAAGLFTRRVWPFCLWTFVAVAGWTPVLVLASAGVGGAMRELTQSYLAWAPAFGLPAAAILIARWLARSSADARV